MPAVTLYNEHRTIDADAGVNLRELMLRVGVSPYRGLDMVLNCRGHNICGTCAVELVDGKGAGPRTQEEESTLRGSLAIAHEVGKNLRLSCQTKVMGDMTVKTRPSRPVDREATKERLLFVGIAVLFGIAFLGTFGFLFLDMIKKF
jgi:ferredoxin